MPGEVSSAVTASGAFDAQPTVTTPKVTKLATTQRSVLIAGTGQKLKSGDTVSIAYTLYNATTQKSLGPVGYGEGKAESVTVGSTNVAALDEALQCSKVGDRFALALAGSAITSADRSNLGLAAGDVLVMVVDAVGYVPPVTPLPWTTGVPNVDLSGTTPKIDLTGLTAPTDLRLAVLTKGTGAVVKAGENVVLDYQGVSWNTKTIFDQSFGKTPTTLSSTGVITGFGAAMVGQRIGSTLLVSIPPAQAYGTDTSASALANQTLLFLIKLEKAAS